MKPALIFCTIFLCSVLPVLCPAQTVNTVNPEKLANRIITSVANVKAGEMVLIEGDKEQIELMETLAEQIHKKGAYPILMLQSEKVEKAYALSVPEEHLVAHHKAIHKLDGKADLTIFLSNNIDYAAINKQVPQAYADKRQKVRQEAHKGEEEDLRTFKQVYINLPTKAVADANGLEYGVYEKMINEAIAADYTAIAVRGKQIASLLKTGKKVTITTASGSNFSFELAGRPATIDDGVISEEDLKSQVKLDRYTALPSGFVVVSGIETSASGKVFSPRDRFYGSTGEEKVTNLSFDFSKGKVTNLKAGTNQAFIEKIFKDADPMMNQFAGFAIGLNPAMKVLNDEKQDYRPIEAEGHVSILIGNNDSWGGTNKVKEGMVFSMEKATVSIDGTVIVKEGKLMVDKLANSK